MVWSLTLLLLGKSTLPHLLADTANAGRHARYICYNRPLADHIARAAPPRSEVSTFHQLCEKFVRTSGFTPDFSRADAFDDLVARYTGADAAGDPVDELIVDE